MDIYRSPYRTFKYRLELSFVPTLEACRLIRVLRGAFGSLQFLHMVRCHGSSAMVTLLILPVKLNGTL